MDIIANWLLLGFNGILKGFDWVGVQFSGIALIGHNLEDKYKIAYFTLIIWILLIIIF